MILRPASVLISCSVGKRLPAAGQQIVHCCPFYTPAVGYSARVPRHLMLPDVVGGGSPRYQRDLGNDVPDRAYIASRLMPIGGSINSIGWNGTGVDRPLTSGNNGYFQYPAMGRLHLPWPQGRIRQTASGEFVSPYAESGYGSLREIVQTVSAQFRAAGLADMLSTQFTSRSAALPSRFFRRCLKNSRSLRPGFSSAGHNRLPDEQVLVDELKRTQNMLTSKGILP